MLNCGFQFFPITNLRSIFDISNNEFTIYNGFWQGVSIDLVKCSAIDFSQRPEAKIYYAEQKQQLRGGQSDR